MPKLRKHRRAAAKISKAVEDRRLAKFSKHPLFRQDAETIRYRVEIWRVDEPEIRLTQFPMEYVRGKFLARDVVSEIAEHLFNWLDRRLSPSDHSPYEKPVPENVWDTPYTPPTVEPERAGKGRGKHGRSAAVREFQSGTLFDSLPKPLATRNDDNEPF